jgi:hypothetical protein
MSERRSTADTVLLLLAGSTAFIIIASGLAIILSLFLHPDADLTTAARGIGDLINTLVGALIGYLAGSRVRGAPPPGGPPT